MENSTETDLDKSKFAAKTESRQSFLGLIKSWLPILSVLIIFLSLLKDWIYYTHFGIKIQFYLTVPELLLAISDELTIILIGVSVYFMMAFIYMNSKKSVINGILEDKFEFNRLRIYLGELVGVSTSALMLLILSKKWDWFSFIFVSSSILYPALFLEVAIWLKKKGKKLNYKLFHVISVTIVFLILFFYITSENIQKTDKGRYWKIQVP